LNKIIGFVIFVAIISGAVYVNDTFSSYEAQLNQCRQSVGNTGSITSAERDNLNIRVRSCEEKMISVLKESDDYKNTAVECDGRIEAAKRSCSAGSINADGYNNLMAQLRVCSRALYNLQNDSAPRVVVPSNNTGV
jgi:hypothetical protein